MRREFRERQKLFVQHVWSHRGNDEESNRKWEVVYKLLKEISQNQINEPLDFNKYHPEQLVIVSRPKNKYFFLSFVSKQEDFAT